MFILIWQLISRIEFVANGSAKLANEAYQAGDVEALIAVLRPPRLRMYFPPWTEFSFRQLLPIAIAFVILVWGGFSLYSGTTSQHAVTNSPAAQAYSKNAPLKARVEVANPPRPSGMET